MRFGDEEWKALRSPGIPWPPRNDDERESMIQFVIDELGYQDTLSPHQSPATALFLRMLEAWERQKTSDAARAEELEKAEVLGLSADQWEAAKAAGRPARGRGRPPVDPMERVPGLEEFIAVDVGRIRDVFQHYWGRRNWTHPMAPSVPEIVMRRWAETAAAHGVELDERRIANLNKRGVKKRKRLVT